MTMERWSGCSIKYPGSATVVLAFDLIKCFGLYHVQSRVEIDPGRL